MRDILDQIVKWWDAGEEFGLATVVATFSSAPREPGAAMATSPAADVVGSVSGGCVEGAVYELSEQVIASGQPVLQRYGVSDESAFSIGLTCGGIIDIFVEPVTGAERARRLGLAGPDHPPGTDLAGTGDHGRHRDRLAGPHRPGDLP